MKYLISLLYAFTLLLSQPASAGATSAIQQFCTQHLTGRIKPLTLYKFGLVPVELAELSDPEYIVKEGSRVRKIFQSMTPEQRAEEPIEFYRRHIPYVLELLNEVPSENMNRPFEFAGPEWPQVSAVIMPVGDAIAKLRQSGEAMSLQNSATPAKFLDFLVDVLSLVHSNTSKHQVHGYYDNRYVAEDKIRLRNMVRVGIIPWPSFANLDAEDFEEWDLGLGFLGLSFSSRPNWDGGKGPRLRFFRHDLDNHMRYLVKIFSSPEVVQEYLVFRAKVWSEFDKLDPDTQKTMRRAWFVTVHESSMLSNFIYILESSKRTNFDSYHNQNSVASGIRLLIRLGDGPAHLRRMSSKNRDEVLLKAEDLFWQILNSNLQKK